MLRGANAEHTLVLIDGVEANDPSSVGGAYNFANMMALNIDRIEVLKGPQSTLYGSHAIGGVINIITKKGKSGKPTGFISLEGGSYYTANEKVALSGGTDKINFSVAASRLDSAGFSSASSKYGNKEKDPYQNTSVNAKVGVTPTSNFNMDFILNYVKGRSGIDNSGGVNGDNLDYVQKSSQLNLSAQAELSLFEDFFFFIFSPAKQLFVL